MYRVDDDFFTPLLFQNSGKFLGKHYLAGFGDTVGVMRAVEMSEVEIVDVNEPSAEMSR